MSCRWRWKPCETAGFVLTLVMLLPPARAFNGEWSSIVAALSSTHFQSVTVSWCARLNFDCRRRSNFSNEGSE